MGLSSMQGQNNLRFCNTANSYNNQFIRLDTTTTTPQYNKIPTIAKNDYASQSYSMKTKLPESILKPTSFHHQNNHIHHPMNHHAFERKHLNRQISPLFTHARPGNSPIDLIKRMTYGNQIRIPFRISSRSRLKRPKSRRHTIRRPSIISNLPLINVNSSIVLVNHSPFGIRDPRFGLFHHCSQSISYF